MKVGFVGWRGMVGSVLMQRMKEENDFAHIPEAFFFTTYTAVWDGKSFVRSGEHTTGSCKGFTGGAWVMPIFDTRVER